jgi:arginyl-tRNA synthetase
MIIKAKDKTDELNNTVASEQLCKTIALGALKFYILKVSCKKRMLFDPNKSICLQGDTGPFVQYTYVRTQSILRQFENEIKGTISPHITLDLTVRNVMIAICEYHSKLLDAVKMYDPSIVTQYVLKLARLYNQFYEQLPIKKETDLDKQNLRLLISKITGEVIKKCLSILGIDVPFKM